MNADFRPLAINAATLRESIVNETPLFTQRLLMQLNPSHWSQYFAHTLTEGVQKRAQATLILAKSDETNSAGTRISTTNRLNSRYRNNSGENTDHTC